MIMNNTIFMEFTVMHSGMEWKCDLYKISHNILIISPDLAPYKAALGFRTELDFMANIELSKLIWVFV